MKSLIVILGLVTAVFTLKVSAQHEHHGMDHKSMDHGDMTVKYDVDKAFQEQLTEVIKANQKLNDAFVSGEIDNVKSAIEKVEGALSAVDMNLLYSI